MSDRPYRANVGAVLFDAAGLVLVARRTDQPASAPSWQLPQGGIDPGEEPRHAVMRELREEIGTDRASILAEHDEWLTYDFPPDVAARLGSRHRGQRQRWFALRFEGAQSDIRLDADPHPEFDAVRWVKLATLPDLAVSWKRPVYEVLAGAFKRFAG